MIGTPQRHVCFVGNSVPARQMLSDILSSRGVTIRASKPPNNGAELGVHDDCAMLVVELDGDAPQGLQHVTALRQKCPYAPVLAIVDRGNIPLAVEAIRVGAAHCLEKPVNVEEMTAAIDELLSQIDLRATHAPIQLTPMEMTVLGHILEGRTSREIAKLLCRSPRTVEVHRSHIMHKLDVSTMVDLVKAASAMGLFET